MITNALKKIFGTRNDRELKRMGKVVKQINALEEGLQALSDDELKAKPQAFRDRVAGGESLDKLLPEAFAVVREAGKRTMGMRHFDVQLIGGMALHEGKIAEMQGPPQPMWVKIYGAWTMCPKRECKKHARNIYFNFIF